MKVPKSAVPGLVPTHYPTPLFEALRCPYHSATNQTGYSPTKHVTLGSKSLTSVPTVTPGRVVMSKYLVGPETALRPVRTSFAAIIRKFIFTIMNKLDI